jgi:hypothetical protein
MAIGVDGTFMIGNSSTGEFEQGALVAGNNITITDLPGAIQIDVTGGTGTDAYARTKANGAVQTGFPTINVAGQNNIVATSNTDTLILVGTGNTTITLDSVTNTITIHS